MRRTFTIWLEIMFRVLMIPAIFLILALAGCRSNKDGIAGQAEPVASPSPIFDTGLTDLNRVKPGMLAPDFELEDINQKKTRLYDFRGRKFVVMVFYRGYFGPDCVDQLGKLKTLLTPEEKQNVQIIAISGDTHAESQVMMSEVSEMPGPFDYPLLEDKGYRVIGDYGIFNPAEFKPGIPYPIVYVINKDGRVTDRLLDLERGARATNFQIREALQRIGAIK